MVVRDQMEYAGSRDRGYDTEQLIYVRSPQRRRKEIEIRKVLGASVFHLVVRMSGENLALVGVSLVLALPPAWFATNAFLGRFAYRVGLKPANFLMAGGIVAALRLVCTGYQVIRASMVDPAKTLRTE